ncbi:MAG: acylneuraminate cytidylyltransferase family protein [Candidatus Omnitrophota bacterium]
MPEGLKVLGVIPARGGSKGIFKKNIQPLYGKPLIAYVINAAKEALLLDHFIVSTESEEIAGVAGKCGADVPFLRPEKYATDTISVTIASKHALEFFDAQGVRYDAVISLQPTSPLTQAGDIDACIKKMTETDCDSVVSMKFLEEVHPWRIYNMQADRVVPFNEYTNENFPQRQDRPAAYKMSGAIFLRKRHLLEKWNEIDFALGQDKRGILIPPDRSVDVNCPEDLLVAEALLKKENGEMRIKR